MYFSINDLQQFYKVLGLNSTSPELEKRLAALRNNLSNQPIEIRYLLENIEVHVIDLLIEMNTLFSSRSLQKSNLLTSKQFPALNNELLNRHQWKTEELYVYIQENFKLALPLCKKNLINIEKIKSMLKHQECYLSSSKTATKDTAFTLESLQRIIKDGVMIKTLDSKSKKEFDKKFKFIDLKLTLSYLLANIGLEENDALLWPYLAFCFLCTKAIENKAFYDKALVAYQAFIKEPLLKKLTKLFKKPVL